MRVLWKSSLVVGLFISVITASRAEILVEVNGKSLPLRVPPKIVKGCTMVPMRQVCEALGARVQWDAAGQTITTTKDDMTLLIDIKRQCATVNGQTVQLNVSPMEIDGTTLAPLHLIHDTFLTDITWSTNTRTIAIRESAKKGFVQNIESMTVNNTDFRHVLYTGKHLQLVVMSLQPKEEIGMETHQAIDQFLRIEQGSGEAIINGVRTPISAGFAVLVPAGAQHNIVNTGTEPLKLYTLYAPPNHRDGVIQQTRAAAMADKEKFDGKTTE
ncbi:MAG TPA: stalk domain-containing protein [Armatimonadota bacterium]|jgi:mannose-6-phosphate isomerase-like protein (cupin superfamily)